MILLENEKIKSDTNISVISDIHYRNSMYNQRYLDYVCKKLGEVESDYICIVGDLFDHINGVEIGPYLEFFNSLLDLCSKKIVISLGNHDMYLKISGRWVEDYSYDLFDKISSVSPRIIVKINEMYETLENIRFICPCANYDFYETYRECDEEVINFFKNSSFGEISDDFYNILLFHSPIILKKEIFEKIELLKDIDLALFGHYHSGLIFDFLKPILDHINTEHVGLISPQKRLFPKHAYGLEKKDDFVSYVSSGVVKFNFQNNMLMQMLNSFYTPDVETIKLVRSAKNSK